ncbi:MAG: nucleotidyltransferase domain-containing protein [Sphingomonas adhaesiva]|uniref:nucleotidyltransferase domain-containing protein n=1 Tax=Sphingomonas adhaesiva TaxID=28212 RepID=UPI002FFAD519
MRLSADQVSAIKAAALEAFGPSATVRLFGSRADDDRTGGDIDLHVEADPDVADLAHEVLFRASIWKALDEEQIDVVVAARGAEPRWIDRAARREGIVL